MKKGNDNGMGEGKQEQNLGRHQDNDVTRKKDKGKNTGIGNYNSATNLKRITMAKTNGKRRAKVLKWEGGKIGEKNWKINVERTAGK